MNNPRPIVLGSYNPHFIVLGFYSHHPIVLGFYSPSQNGIIVSPLGIAPCLVGGGKGHDVDKPKILIAYD